MAQKRKAAKSRKPRRAARPARRSNRPTAASAVAQALPSMTSEGLPGALAALGLLLQDLRILMLRGASIAYPIVGSMGYAFGEATNIRVTEALGLGNSRDGELSPSRTQVSLALAHLNEDASSLLAFQKLVNESLGLAFPPADGTDEPTFVPGEAVKTKGSVRVGSTSRQW